MPWLLTNSGGGTWGFNRKLYRPGEHIVIDEAIVEAAKKAPKHISIRALTLEEMGLPPKQINLVEDVKPESEPVRGASPKELAEFYTEHPEIEVKDKARAKELAGKAGEEEVEEESKEPSTEKAEEPAKTGEPFKAQVEPVTTDELLTTPSTHRHYWRKDGTCACGAIKKVKDE